MRRTPSSPVSTTSATSSRSRRGRASSTRRGRDADLLYLNHLTPMNEAAAREFADVPVIGHIHGPELLMLERIAEGAPAELDLRGGVARAHLPLGRRLRPARRQHAAGSAGARRSCSTSTRTASPSSPTASTARSSLARSTAVRTGESIWSTSRWAGAQARSRAASATARRISTPLERHDAPLQRPLHRGQAPRRS